MSDEMVRDYLRQEPPANKLLLLVNPFPRLTGLAGPLLGLLSVAATVAVGVYGQVHYDGIWDVHAGMEASRTALALEPLADWLVVAALFLVCGMLLGPKPQRLVDYLTHSAIGRLPFVVVGLLWTDPLLGRLLPGIMKLAPAPAGPQALTSVPGLPFLIIGAIITMLVMFWGLFLNFFALREASGMKTGRALAAFAVICVLGEIISKFIAIRLSLV